MGRRSKRGTQAYSSSANKNKGRDKRSVLEEQEVAQTAPSYISLLPQPVLTDILSQLPLKTIYSCRCVSKTWLKLLLEPQFAQFYPTRAPPSIILQPRSDGHKQYLYAVDLEASGNGNTSYISHYRSRVKFSAGSHLPIQSEQKLELVDSCNGLILLCESWKSILQSRTRSMESPYVLYVCNPVTGEYVIVRFSPTRFTPFSYTRLGFCPRTREFKVVMFGNRENEPLGLTSADVYTLGGEGVWRPVLFRTAFFVTVNATIFLNGFIHWVPWGHEIFLCSFDVENEQFLPVPPPLQYESSANEYKPLRMSLGILRGCLAIGEVRVDAGCFDIWVMMSYGVQASWTKECTIKADRIYSYRRPYSKSRILGLLRNGDILMLHDEKILVSYYRANGLSKYHRVDKVHYFQALTFVPNLSSFGEIASREEVLNARLRSK